MVAYVGENVTIRCEGLPVNDEFLSTPGPKTNPVRWEMKRAGTMDTLKTFFVSGRLFSDETFCPRCFVNTTEFTIYRKSFATNLTIAGVEPTHAGIFACSFAPNQKGTTRYYELEVLGEL
jgi:hypothetical protein